MNLYVIKLARSVAVFISKGVFNENQFQCVSFDIEGTPVVEFYNGWNAEYVTLQKDDLIDIFEVTKLRYERIWEKEREEAEKVKQELTLKKEKEAYQLYLELKKRFDEKG